MDNIYNIMDYLHDLQLITDSLRDLPSNDEIINYAKSENLCLETSTNNTNELTQSNDIINIIYKGRKESVTKNRNQSIVAHTAKGTTGIKINNAGSNGLHENRPPYYILAFIMRT